MGSELYAAQDGASQLCSSYYRLTLSVFLSHTTKE